MPNVWFLGHAVILCLLFKKKVFQSACFFSFFYHQFMSHPTFSCPCKHLVLSLHIFAIPLGRKSYLTKALTYILFQLTFSKWCWTSFHLPSVIFSEITIHAFSFSNWVVSVIIVECLLSSVYLSPGDFKTLTQFLCISYSSHELLAKKSFVFDTEKD